MTKRKFTLEELKDWLFDLWEYNYHVKINNANFDTVKLDMYYDKMLDNMEFYSHKDKNLVAPVYVINLFNIKSVCGYDIEIVNPFCCNQKEI